MPKFDIIAANAAMLLVLSLIVLVVVAAPVAANFVIAPSSLCQSIIAIC
jgi:hypothetical protein